MKINKEIEEKAKDIIVRKLQEEERKEAIRDYITLCLQAGICPNCGKDLSLASYQEGVYVNHIYKCSSNQCKWEKEIKYPDIVR